MFPAFFDHPTNIRFAEQEEDEVIELLLRQHGIVNLPWILMAIFASFIPLIIIQLDFALDFGFIALVPPNILTGFLIIWFMLIIGYIIENFLYWYFNIYIVTNMHIVDINFHNLLYRETTESRLEDIQSVTPSIKGIIGSLFHFGDVLVETAAEKKVLTFGSVPKPDIVADRIQDLQARRE